MTSVSGYAGPLANVSWFKQYWKATRSTRVTMYAIMGIYLFLIFVALSGKRLGFESVPWIIALGVDLFLLANLLILGFYPVIAAWFLGFLAGQPGGQDGLSAEDGLKTAQDFAVPIVRGLLWILFYASVAFYFIAIFPVETDAKVAFAILALSIGITAGSILLYGKSHFFAGLVLFVKLSALLWLLGSVTPGVKDAERKLVNLFQTHVASNPADRAREAFLQKRRADLVNKEKVCREALPVNPTAKALARCEAMRQAIDEPLVTDELLAEEQAAKKRQRDRLVREAAECFSKLADDATPAAFAECQALSNAISTPSVTTSRVVSTAPTAAETTPVPAATNCRTEYKGDYNPDEFRKPTLLSDLEFCAGDYEFKSAGLREQQFNVGTPSPSSIHTNCFGERLTLVLTPGQWWTGTMPILLPAPADLKGFIPLPVGSPYGACVISAMTSNGPVALNYDEENKVMARKFTLPTSAKLQIRLNVQNGSWGGPSQLFIEIKKVS